MSREFSNIENFFGNLPGAMHRQFFDVVRYFIHTREISVDELQANEHLYEAEIIELWERHCELLDNNPLYRKQIDGLSAT